jgi:hypothetical protein
MSTPNGIDATDGSAKRRKRGAKPRKKAVTRLLQNPILNGAGIVIGLAGLIFAVYAYIDSQSAPFLTARIGAVRTVLVSSEGIQDLQVYDQNGPISGPVTAAQIVIWNAGKRTIKADDVSQPIRVRIAERARILSIRVLRTTRESMGITVDSSAAASGSFGVRFGILEEGDGALIQVTYEGTDKLKFVGSGAVAGQRGFEVIEESHPDDSLIVIPRRGPASRAEYLLARILFTAALLGLLFAVAYAWLRNAGWWRQNVPTKGKLAATATVVFYVALSLVLAAAVLFVLIRLWSVAIPAVFVA